MFSALNQGSLIYILDKTDRPTFKIGEVVSTTQPQLNLPYGNSNYGPIDLKVKIDGSIHEYNSIPSSNSIITYNSGKITLSETKQGLQSEVESILQNSKQILDNIDKYQNNIIDCENILKQLNPQFAKDKERDDRLNNLEQRFDGVENKLDKLLNLVTTK